MRTYLTIPREPRFAAKLFAARRLAEVHGGSMDEASNAAANDLQQNP
jgi:hypothetical protein